MELKTIIELVGFFIVVSGTVTGLAIAWGKLTQRFDGLESQFTRHEAEDEKTFAGVNRSLEKIESLCGEIGANLTRFEVVLIGIDENNGMRGEIRELKSDLKELSERVADMRNGK